MPLNQKVIGSRTFTILKADDETRQALLQRAPSAAAHAEHTVGTPECPHDWKINDIIGDIHEGMTHVCSMCLKPGAPFRPAHRD